MDKRLVEAVVKAWPKVVGFYLVVDTGVEGPNRMVSGLSCTAGGSVFAMMEKARGDLAEYDDIEKKSAESAAQDSAKL
jgi:hypothetical protein